MSNQHIIDKHNMIKEITQISAADIPSLQLLLKTLSPNCIFSENDIEKTIQSPNCHLYGLYQENSLVGMYTLGIYHSPTGSKACLEDFVVHPDFQGKGYGRLMIEHLQEQIKKLQIKQLLFTSKPSRTAANHLYVKMGFKRKETNVYIMNNKE